MFADDPDASDLTFDPGPKHSTPIKDKPYTGIQRRDGSPSLLTTAGQGRSHFPERSRASASVPAANKSGSRPHAANVSSSNSSSAHNSSSGKSSIMKQVKGKDSDWLISQQRKEIALLIKELRDRDHELNDLVRAHQQQLSVWEQDKQLILRLQHRCQRFAAELKQQRQKSGGVYTKSAGERRGSGDSKSQGDSSHHLSASSDHSMLHLQQLQNHNDTLNDSLKEMTLAKGQLEAKEQELVTLLKLKDDKAAEAEKSAGELKAQVKVLKLEKENYQTELQQLIALWQQRCCTLQDDKDKLVTACQEKDRQLQQATTQLQETLQQALELQQALTISCEREKNKEELLISVRARQERLYQELTQMRTLYKRQNREMTLMQLSLDTSKESEPELSDNDNKFGARGGSIPSKANTSLTSASKSPSLASVSLTSLQGTAEQDMGICASSTPRPKAAPVYGGGGSEENTDSSGDQNVSQTMQRGSHHHHGRTTHSYLPSRGSSAADTVGDYANYRSAGFEYSPNPRAKYNCNVNNNCNPGAEPSPPELLLHNPREASQPDSGDPHSSVHQAGQLPSPDPEDREEEEEAGIRVSDVDTEAFWQKILSVRHGNQNNVQETKDLNPSPAKSWFAEVCVQDTVASHYQADLAQGSQGSLERLQQEQKAPGAGFLNNQDCLILSGSCAMTTSCSNTMENQTGQQPVHSSDFITSSPLQQATTHQNWPPNQTREFSEEAPVPQQGDFVSVSYTQPQQPSWDQPQKLSSNEAFMNSGQCHLQQKPKSEDSQMAGTHGMGHDDATEMAPAISAPFDEKLSSFLESPEDDVSYDPSGSRRSSSPASKLYRLLMESQEMIKALEVRGHPDPQ